MSAQKIAKQPEALYTASMRVLGSKVHKDPLYQFYYNAVLISFGCGVKPVGLEMLKTETDPKITAWTDGGGPDVLAAVRPRAPPSRPPLLAPRRTPSRTPPCIAGGARRAWRIADGVVSQVERANAHSP